MHSKDKAYLRIIGAVSVLIPVVVSLLIFIPQTGKLGDIDVSFLPHLNGVLNTATSLVLLLGFYFIKTGRPDYHKTAMLSALGMSALFLVSYVLYHFQAPPTKYGGVGTARSVYFFLLLTHIVLAAVVVPLVLISVYFALSGQLARHKRLVKWAFPVWLYVSVTGVVVYLMISPYYKA